MCKAKYTKFHTVLNVSEDSGTDGLPTKLADGDISCRYDPSWLSAVLMNRVDSEVLRVRRADAYRDPAPWPFSAHVTGNSSVRAVLCNSIACPTTIPPVGYAEPQSCDSLCSRSFAPPVPAHNNCPPATGPSALSEASLFSSSRGKVWIWTSQQRTVMDQLPHTYDLAGRPRCPHESFSALTQVTMLESQNWNFVLPGASSGNVSLARFLAKSAFSEV